MGFFPLLQEKKKNHVYKVCVHEIIYLQTQVLFAELVNVLVQLMLWEEMDENTRSFVQESSSLGLRFINL